MNQVPPILGYTQGNGSSSSSPYVELFSERDPTANDTNYPIQKRWFNVITNTEWILVSFTTTNANLQANWQEISTASEAVLEFTGGTGTTRFPVVPNASGQIQLTSSALTLSITGSTNNINFDISGLTPLTTYTPILSSSGGGETVSYTGSPTGSYSITNGICTIGFLIVATVSGSPSGLLQISLPFRCTRQVCFGIGRVSIGGSSNWIGPYQIQFSNSVCNILNAASGSLVTLTTTTYNLAATITYFVG
jgi:hypothetical protein